MEIDPRLLDALYSGATDDAEMERALKMMADAFRCLSAALVSIDARAPSSSLILSVGVFDAAAREAYSAHFVALDPAPPAFGRMPAGTASTTDRILPPGQLSGEFANDFYRPLGLAETLGGNLQSDPLRFELIGLHRGPDREAFDDGELYAVERLLPHLVRSLQMRRMFLRLNARAAGLEAAIDRLASGVALLDPDGAALFVNRAMTAIAARRDGLALDRRGRPVAAGQEARRRIDALLHEVGRGGAGGVATAPRVSGGRPYVVLVAPAPPVVESSLLGWRSAHCAIVIVHDPANVAPSGEEILQQGLGLTPGAARLVAALAADDDLRSYAAREGITIHAVRFHLRTALARTGARTQAELVRIAVRVLRDVGLRMEQGTR